jgi:Flp pilus assembly CpaE family ATPase
MRARSSRNYWKPLIICPHPAMAPQIRAAMGELGVDCGLWLQEYPQPAAIAGLAAEHQANLCFLDIATQQEQALGLISETAPFMPVVALNLKNDADLILRCLRRGACEFLSEWSGEQLDGLLDRLARLRAPAQREKPATVYCVVPGKPGCGASTVSVHLAVELKRCGFSRVLLVDADYLAATVGFLLKLKSDFHLDDAVRDCLRLDDDLWGHLVVPCHGIDVLLAPEHPSSAAAVDRPAAVELVCFWREHYEAVVLDTPGAQDSGGCLASLSDEILVVTTNELGPLHATKRTLESLVQSGVPAGRPKLLVNRYTPATGLKAEDVKTALHLACFALLSNDYEILQNAVLEGQPAPAGSHFAKSMHDLAERLHGKQAVPQKTPVRRGWLPFRN